MLEGHAVGRLDFLELGGRQAREVAAEHEHFTGFRPLQAEDGAQQDGLAGAGTADDSEDLALLDGHVEAIVHDLRAEAVHQPTDFDEWFGHQISSSQKATANNASANSTRKIDCTTAVVVRRPSSREESRTCRPR